MAPSKPSPPNRIRTTIETVLTCGALGVASYFGVGWVLDSLYGASEVPELAPIAFGAEVLEEPNDFVADIRAAADTVRQRWSYREHRRELSRVDVDALEREALAMLGENPTPESFQPALTRLIAGLHDGHAGAVAGDYRVPGDYRWPFTLVEVEEGFMVHRVDPELVVEVPAEGSPPGPGLERGDLIREVDGRPLGSWVDDAESFVFASTDLARRRRALEQVARFDVAAQRTFRIERTDGSEAEMTLELPRSFIDIEDPPLLDTSRDHRVVEGNIGYFRPGDFFPPPDSGWPGPPEGRDAILEETYATFDAAIGEFAGCRSLILDLRSNPGGTDLLGQFLVDRLVPSYPCYYRLSSLGGDGWSDYTESGSGAPAGEHAFHGPLICLIDEFTFSTADNVVACLADVHPDVTFVGRPNGAGTGAPRRFELPRTGSRIYFCTMRVKTPSGRVGEGISVEVDVPVVWTREDVLSGRDADLMEALRFAREATPK